MRAITLILGLSLFSGGALAADFPEPLPIEPTDNVATLPASYPDSWIYAMDGNFYSVLDGKVLILDLAATSHEFKGYVGAGQFGSFLAASTRPELYVAETYYSRRVSGERTDAIVIYDKQSLKKKAEIILPGGKRGQSVTQKHSFQFLDNERLALVFNFTPAASVTVVDLIDRKVLNEIPIPGCSLIYPMGKLGFSTLCGNGTMAAFTLDANGKVTGEQRTKKFNDIDNDPLFMKTTKVGNTTYFVSFLGTVQPMDMTGTWPKVGKTWSLVSAEEKAAGWRPGGWHILSSDTQGRLYFLMQEKSYPGSHKDGGGEVWVYDAKSKKRVARHVLKTHAISIEVTRGAAPYLAAVNANMEVDVYDAVSGQHLRTIGGNPAQTIFVMQASGG